MRWFPLFGLRCAHNLYTYLLSKRSILLEAAHSVLTAGDQSNQCGCTALPPVQQAEARGFSQLRAAAGLWGYLNKLADE
jgi:hypothetical protein